MKKLTTAMGVVVACVTLTLTTSLTDVAAAQGAGRAARAARAATITFGQCSEPGLAAAGAECGTLSVPLDYSNPSGRHITLAVSRVRHTSSQANYLGAILVNPGGPGGSGLSFSTLGSAVPGNVGSRYDWIGFDPRGVGASRPRLSCVPNYFHLNRPDYRPRTAHLVAVWKKRTKHYADECQAKHPDLIRHMTTADSARDMNQIRLALGLDKISYYGFSYGTYLGQVYGSLFPTHLKRMVLDSTVNPRRVWYAANLDQDKAFDRNLKIWFAWVAKYHSHYHLGTTEKAVQQLWYSILNKLAKNPAGGQLGPDEWTDVFLDAGYYRTTWLELGSDFAGYVHQHDWQSVADYFLSHNSGGDNMYAVYSAVQCTDAPWPRSWSTWKADNTRVYAKAPFLTWDNAWYNAPCLYWHAPAHKPVTIRGGRVASALLIDETLDAATPYSGSVVVRRMFPNSSLIAEPGGTTHADSLFGDSCVDNRIATYLASGHRPARQSGDGPDLSCRPLPNPRP